MGQGITAWNHWYPRHCRSRTVTSMFTLALSLPRSGKLRLLSGYTRTPNNTTYIRLLLFYKNKNKTWIPFLDKDGGVPACNDVSLMYSCKSWLSDYVKHINAPYSHGNDESHARRMNVYDEWHLPHRTGPTMYQPCLSGFAQNRQKRFYTCVTGM